MYYFYLFVHAKVKKKEKKKEFIPPRATKLEKGGLLEQ